MNALTFNSREPVCFVSWKKNSNPSSISLGLKLSRLQRDDSQGQFWRWKTSDVFTFLLRWNFKVVSRTADPPMLLYLCCYFINFNKFSRPTFFFLFPGKSFEFNVHFDQSRQKKTTSVLDLNNKIHFLS